MLGGKIWGREYLYGSTFRTQNSHSHTHKLKILTGKYFKGIIVTLFGGLTNSLDFANVGNPLFIIILKAHL